MVGSLNLRAQDVFVPLGYDHDHGILKTFFPNQEQIQADCDYAVVISSFGPFTLGRLDGYDELCLYFNSSMSKINLVAHVYEEPDILEIDSETEEVINVIKGKQRMGPELVTFCVNSNDLFATSFKELIRSIVLSSSFQSEVEVFDGLNYFALFGNKLARADGWWGNCGKVEALFSNVAMAIYEQEPQRLMSYIPQIEEMTDLFKSYYLQN